MISSMTSSVRLSWQSLYHLTFLSNSEDASSSIWWTMFGHVFQKAFSTSLGSISTVSTFDASTTCKAYALHILLGHICLYAYMNKVNPNIFWYFLWFYSCITFISLFAHHSNFFSKIFPIFPAILLTSKAYHFDTALLILLLFKHPHSHTSCGIKSYHMQHAHSLRRAKWSWSRGQKQGICRLRHSLAFPSSVFWQSLRRWEPTVSIPLLY